MKTGLKIVGVLIGCILLLLLVLRVTGFEPRECPTAGVALTCRLPGLWLRGKPAAAPADWSFTNQYQTVKVQTRDRLLLPYSVTTYCVSHNGQLYLTSVYAPGLPGIRAEEHWNENVARDPRRAGQVSAINSFDRTLILLTSPDPDERAAVIRTIKLRNIPSRSSRLAPTSMYFTPFPPTEKAPAVEASVVVCLFDFNSFLPWLSKSF